jgi:DNA topoisomerase-1
MKLRKQLFQIAPKKYKKNLEYTADESDMEEDWIIEHEKQLIEKEKERTTTRFEKSNEKLIAEGKAPLPMTDLTEKMKTIDEVAKRLKKEHKTGKVEPKSSMTEEKALTQIAKIDERISATRIQATDREENKEIALGTSKMNYIDPRITIVWCKNNDVPLEKVFSKTLIDKFRWAQNTPLDWVSPLLHTLNYYGLGQLN